LDFVPIGNFADRCFVQASVPDRDNAAVKKTTEESPKSIGIFIRKRRLASGLTQQELGELAGVGTRLISELERGKTTLRMDAVNRVLRVFGRMLGQVEAPRDEDTE